MAVESQIVLAPSGQMVDRDTGIIVQQPRGFVALDPYAPGGIAEQESRPTWLAAISAGHKVKTNKGEIPQSSKQGEIYIHIEEGEGGGLIALLGAEQDSDYEHCFVSPPSARLMVALGSDAEWDGARQEWDLSGIFSQRLVRRSAGALQVYGDHTKLTEIVLKNVKVTVDGKEETRRVPEHVDHYAGSPRFAELLPTTKAETRMLFCLAEWTEQQRARMPFPDGLGWYSLRFTSRWSRRSLVGKLQEVCSLTQGHLRGIPFGLFISYMNVPGPDGKTRKIPVWRLEFKPPTMLALSSDNFRSTIGGALEEGRKLLLIEQPKDTIEHAQRVEDVDLDSPEAIEILTNGSPQCNAEEWEARWFSFVKGTSLEGEQARGAFLERFTQGATSSLATFLDSATDADCGRLLGEAAEQVGEEREAATNAAVEAALAAYRAHQGRSDGEATVEGARDDAAAAQPEPPKGKRATAEGSSARPSKERGERYAWLMLEASEKNLDLAPFETNADTSAEELDTLIAKLEAALGVEQAQAGLPL